MAHRFRRRFVGAAATVVGFLVVLSLLSGLLFDGRDRRAPERPRGHPFALVGFAATVLLIGSAGSAFAYRRLSRPVGDLLDAAEQVADGDFEVGVVPGGPRELRALAEAFNQMAGRLATTHEERRRFLADVSHELRTPLAVLQSGLEAQLDGIHARDDEHLGSLLEEARRLGRLVDDLHTLALADAGRLVLHREPIDPGVLVDDTLAAHRALGERKQVTLEADVAQGLPTLDVDPTRVRQVLDNLLSNAVRHTPAGAGVTLVARPEQPDERAGDRAGDRAGVRITVTDAGPGFPPDQLAHVFDRFTRAVDSRGSGLGLSIARDLVQAHGGTISARNLPGGGASVEVTLPARSDAPMSTL